MPDTPNENPLRQLIRSLPASVAKEKRKAIRIQLEARGKYEHYRQCVLRKGWKLGDTHIACVEVLMQQLGVTVEFFTGSGEEQDRQIRQINSRLRKPSTAL